MTEAPFFPPPRNAVPKTTAEPGGGAPLSAHLSEQAYKPTGRPKGSKNKPKEDDPLISVADAFKLLAGLDAKEVTVMITCVEALGRVPREQRMNVLNRIREVFKR